MNLCCLNDSDIKPIAQALSNGLRLEQLSLSYNRLGDTAVADLTEGLAHSKAIKMINLSNNRVRCRVTEEPPKVGEWRPFSYDNTRVM